MKIHFICRGNVFRSFIAETYLRSLQIPNVSVYSSGTLAARYKTANTPNHRQVRTVLKERGLAAYMKDEFAEQLTQDKLDQADLNIFVYHVAHEEAQQHGFTIPDNARVWNIHDFDSLGQDEPSEEERLQFITNTVDMIMTEVDSLVDELSSD